MFMFAICLRCNNFLLSCPVGRSEHFSHLVLYKSRAFFASHGARSPQFPFPLSLDLPLAAAAPEAGFSSCLSREEKCFSRLFYNQVSDHHVLRYTPEDSILKVQRTAMTFAVLKVQADGNKNYPEFSHRVASSSRLWFHPIASRTTARCHSSIRPSNFHGGPRRIRLCR